MIFVSRDLRQGLVKYASPIVTDASFHHVYITPEIREKAMNLLSKSRKSANGAPLGDMPQACVVEEEHLPVYIREEDEEKAMKILTTLPVPENEMYTREARKAEVYTGPSNTDYVSAKERKKAMKLLEKDDGYHKAGAPTPRVMPTEAAAGYVTEKAKEKAVELHAKTEQDEYNKKPKLVNGANPQFLVVRYGWYAFAFLLEEGDVRGPDLNAKAIQICEAMLTLEGGGEDTELKYHTSYAQQAQRAYRSAHPDTKKALKKFITTR